MGSSNSVPKRSDMEYVFPVDHVVKIDDDGNVAATTEVVEPLGMNHNVMNKTSGPPVNIIVKANLWGPSLIHGDTFPLNYYNGTTFGDDLYIVRGMGYYIHRIILMSKNAPNVPVAICIQEKQNLKFVYKICTMHPTYQGQDMMPSEYKYHDHGLYLYARVVRDPYVTKGQHWNVNTSFNGGKCLYKISGGLPTNASAITTQRRTVKKNGKICSYMEYGTWKGIRNSFKVTVFAGIDQCLMVLLCCIADKVDDKGYDCSNN